MCRHINLSQMWCIVYNYSILFRNRIHYLKTFKKIPHKTQKTKFILFQR